MPKVLVDQPETESGASTGGGHRPGWIVPAVCAAVCGFVLAATWLVSRYEAQPTASVEPYLLANVEAQLESPAAATSTLGVVRLLAGKDTLGNPSDLAIFPDCIVILDPRPLHTNGQMLVLDRDTGAIVAAAGPEGQGPTDLYRPNALQGVRGDSPAVWINDYANARLVRYQISPLADGPEDIVNKPGPWIHQFAWLGEGEALVGGGLFATELMREYHIGATHTAVVARTIGGPLFPAVPPAVAQQLNRGAIAAAPDGARFVLAFQYTSRLQLYDKDVKLVRSIAGPVEVIPAYTYEDGIFRLDSELGRFAYRDVAATNDHIFALFSGQARTAGGRQLHVFNWAGKLEGVWRIEDELGWIAVDPANGALFGVRWEPEPAIVEYGSVFSEARAAGGDPGR